MWKQPATVRLCTYIILHRHSTVGTSLQPHKKGYSDLWPPNSNQFSLKSRWRFVLNLTKKNPFWRIVLTRFEVNVTLTFDFHNLISLSKSQSCHWCQIWRNSLKVILRYCSQCATNLLLTMCNFKVTLTPDFQNCITPWGPMYQIWRNSRHSWDVAFTKCDVAVTIDLGAPKSNQFILVSIVYVDICA